MSPLPTTDWLAALDRMTASLDRMFVDLDHYQTVWAQVTDAPASVSPPELLLTWLERRLAQWDASVTAASEVAATVEKQLDDREAAVGRWQEVFVRWQELIQQGLDPAHSSPNTSSG
jgi:hypothetical protein